MKLILDEEAKVAIESLCHSAMVHCPREAFTQNLAFVIKVLSAVEVETPDPPPPQPNEP